jgi:predicted enzyme related to lactoylglutathione lyase
MTTAAKVGITGIDASYYLTKDLNKATAFYTGLFGTEPTMHVPNTVSEWTFDKDGTTFGLYQPEDAANWRPSGGLLFHVDNIKASKDAAVTVGSTFEDHVEDTPGCYMAFGTDPEGNTFILHQYK